MLTDKPISNLAVAIAAIVALTSCALKQTQVGAASERPKLEVRVDLAKYGLPKDFFEFDADTKCGGQVIGYRFVAWLDRDEVIVGFNTSPNCRLSPNRKVTGCARILAFDGRGLLKVERDIPYLADGNGELVAQGEAGPGPGGSLLFRIGSVNLKEDGSRQSESGVLLVDARLKDVAHIGRFLEQTTFINHALVFQDGFTLGHTRTYSIFDNVPPVQVRRVEMNWPVDARDRKFGEQGLAYIACQQEVRPNERVSTPVIYAGAAQSCKMTALTADGRSWTDSLPDGETASIIGLLSDGSVLGNLHIKGSSAGQLVLWKEGRPLDKLPWIPDRYCGSIESATRDLTRYGSFPKSLQEL